MFLRQIFGIILFIIGLSAISGGIGLITNKIAPPISLLHGYFPSYLIPGIILTFVVGGTHLLAAFSIFKKIKIAPELSAVAGFGMLIWLFTEIYIIQTGDVLQIIYFALGIMTLIASWYLKNYSK
jgi:hypothetical protein